MKRATRLLLLTVPLSFLLGLWWGNYQTEISKAVTNVIYDLTIISLQDSLPPALIKSFEKKTNLKVELVIADDLPSLTQLISHKPYDSIAYKSFFHKNILQQKNISIINSSYLKHASTIAADFWPSNKYNSQAALPYAWGVNGFLGKKGQDFDSAYNDFFNSLKSENVFYLSLDVENIYFMLTQKKPEWITFLEKNKVDLIKEDLDKIREKARFGQQLPALPIASFQQTTNGSAAKWIDNNREYEFYIPESGTLFWMNFMSVSEEGSQKPATYELLNYITDPETQEKEVVSNELASVSQFENSLLLSADYIRKIPLPKLHFAQEIYDPHKAWQSSVRLSLLDIVEKNLVKQE